jgi:hypothetical protein
MKLLQHVHSVRVESRILNISSVQQKFSTQVRGVKGFLRHTFQAIKNASGDSRIRKLTPTRVLLRVEFLPRTH